jgi:hypothetical protein
LWQTLTSVAGTKHSGASRLWQAFVFALFAGAMVLIARDALEARRAPIVIIGVLVFGAFMTAMWPDTLARIVVGLAPAGALILLVPLAIVIAAAALLHLTSEHPLSLHTTEGVTLAMLTVYIAIVVSAARQPLPDLQKARRYFASLLADNRTLRPECVPYAAALGLPVEDLKRPDEDWADALIV